MSAHEVFCWPSGAIRFDGQTLEMTAAGERIALRDIEGLTVKDKRGRLNLRVSYRAGLGVHKTGVWVPAEHAAALQGLVGAVDTARAG
jgi:hypothetical protein